MIKLGNYIRRCRFDKNEMQQKELASAIGVSRQTIYSIEKGRFVPSTLLALQIARFFNKSVEDVFYIIEAE